MLKALHTEKASGLCGVRELGVARKDTAGQKNHLYVMAKHTAHSQHPWNP